MTEKNETKTGTTERRRPAPSPLDLGDSVELSADKLNSQGEGLGRIEGLAVFAPGVLPGERVSGEVVKTAKNFARIRTRQLIEQTSERESARCPVHLGPDDEGLFPTEPSCGGCQLQTYPREKELEFKRQLVGDNLSRIGGIDTEIEPVQSGKAWGYRNKMSFGLTADSGKLFWTLRGYEDDSVSLPSCDIASPELWEAGERILEALNEEFGPELAWDGEEGYVRSVTVRTHTGRPHSEKSYVDRASLDPAVVAVFAVTSFETEYAETIRSILAEQGGVRAFFTYSDPRSTGVYFDRGRFLNFFPDKAPVWGEGNYREELMAWHTTGPWSTLVGPTNFLQVNDEMAERLYQRILDLPYERDGFAVDAYCGLGVMTRALPERFARVMGIELDTQAIKLARTTARRLNDCRVEWVAEASERVFGGGRADMVGLKAGKPDLVILDPPRKGCQRKVLQSLNHLLPKDVVYVSCHPAALARDLKILCKKHFKVVRVEPFDLFPQTHHVETLVHLKS